MFETPKPQRLPFILVLRGPSVEIKVSTDEKLEGTLLSSPNPDEVLLEDASGKKVIINWRYVVYIKEK